MIDSPMDKVLDLYLTVCEFDSLLINLYLLIKYFKEKNKRFESL